MKRHFKLLTFIAAIALLGTSCSVTLAPTSYSRRSRSSSSSEESSLPDLSSSSDPSSSSDSSSEESSSSSQATIYFITWKNYDGTILGTDPVVEGNTPVYKGDNPTKESDAQYDYTFSGWTPEVGPATGNREYTAAFTSEIRRYTVVWKNYDDTVIETDENVPYGTTPHFDSAEPSKQPSASTVYIFDGWTPEISDVTGNASYTAKYREEVRQYTITWKNWDGTILKEEKVNYGVVPSYDGDMPERESDAQYDYTFSGWSPSLVAVEGDTEYVAQFDNEVKIYDITWKNYDGTVLSVDKVAFGETPVYSGEEPTRAPTSEYVYVFEGWSPSVVPVEGNAEYTATFRLETRKYTITWKNYDGSTLKSEQVAYGVLPEYVGDTPQKESDFEFVYAFIGWSPTVVPVTGDAEYTAQFSQETRTYTVTWLNFDGSVLEIDNNVAYGTTPHYDGETPTREDVHGIKYSFKGWDQTLVPVWCDATYTAQYTSTASFSFDIIPYETESGYKLSDLKGAPWVNVNLSGEINKIKKPSFKDDFYTYVNYDNIRYGSGTGPFHVSDANTNAAMNRLFDTTNGTTNVNYFYSFYQRVANGDVSHVYSYLNDLNVETYFSSQESLVSHSSFIKLSGTDDGYEVQYNDGYIYDSLGLQTLMFYAQFSGYEEFATYAQNIANTLYESIGLTVSSSDFSTMMSMEQDIGYNVYFYVNSYGRDDATSYTVNTLPWAKMKSALLDYGLSLSDKVTIRDCYEDAFNSIYNSYSDETVKNAIMTRLAFDYRFLLGADNYSAVNYEMSSAGGVFYGEAGLYRYSGDSLYRLMTQVALQSICEQIYIELAGSETVKATVASVIEDVLQGYKDLVNDMSWLSSTTKNGVRRKLDNMAHVACYSDVYKNFPKLSTSGLKTTPLREVYGRYTKAILDDAVRGFVEDDRSWSQMPSYTVNAYYSPTTNSFVILNGIVSGFLGNSVEELYAMLGSVIGHEITHAFDSNGSQYDEYGRYTNWWSSTDKTKFNNKVNKLINFCNKIDQVDGRFVNGNKVNGEATADMGGVRVMLKLAESIPEFDYDLFFRTYAYLWSTPAVNYSYMVNSRINDEHPLNYLRANVTLAQFQEFIDTYDIGPGDGMYIPESERVAIW